MHALHVLSVLSVLPVLAVLPMLSVYSFMFGCPVLYDSELEVQQTEARCLAAFNACIQAVHTPDMDNLLAAPALSTPPHREISCLT